MKFFTAALSLALAATTVVAQNAHIGFPTMGTDVPAGSSLTIEIDQPNFLSSSLEVAVVLAIQSCSSTGGTCHDPETDGFLLPAQILYNGPFHPQYDTPADGRPPHQNFTVQIPDSLAKGTAQIDMVHFNLIGASLGPTIQYDTVQVNIV